MSLESSLRENSYPGRGIVAGLSADGKYAVCAYFIMGRSVNSRNRIFVEVPEDNGIETRPFDIIKVDQSFVRDLDTDAYAQSFVRMVAELAETIGVKICVEGIENKDQLDKLDGMKIKYIQGYYFDKPLVRQEFEKKYVLETKGN